MTLADAVKVAGVVVTAVCFIIGAAWTAYIFLLQRTAHSYISLSLERVSCIRRDNAYALVVRVRAENISKAGVGKSLAWLELAPTKIRQSEIQGILLREIDSTPVRVLVFRDHVNLEPGEEFVEDVLVGASDSHTHIYIRTLFAGPTDEKTWHTQSVIALEVEESSRP